MTAFVKFTDPLFLLVDNAPAGENFYDCRSEWHPLGEITFDSGGLAGTQWYRDSGPIGMAEAKLEPRAFCWRGGLHFDFTGTVLVIRLNVAWSWYDHAVVLIDGAPPSSYVGIHTAVDFLSCDAASYGLTQDGYIDVLVADGLPNAAHHVTITIDNADSAKFYSMSGFKVGKTETLLNKINWAVTSEFNITPNHNILTIENRQDLAILNVSVGMPPGMMDAVGVPYTADVTYPTFPAHSSQSIVFAPVLGGGEPSEDLHYTISLEATYPDPDGSVPISTDFLVDADDPALSFSPLPWFLDNSTPDGGPRRFTVARSTGGSPWWMSLTIDGDALDVTVLRALGWGMLGIYNGPSDGATLLASCDCGVDDGGAYHTYHLTGFGAGPHTLYFRKTLEDGLAVVFARAEWTATATYTVVSETLNLTIPIQQPYGMPVDDPVWGDYDVTFDPPDPDAHDYDHVPVRSNALIETTESLTRTPTFAVFYGTGNRDVLAEYDILVIDPIGARVRDVQYWQAKGIKVFGYIASAQEIGFYQNRYDFASPLAPRSGSGPGGYSLDYMFTQHPDTGPPDKDAVWASYYMNPAPSPSGWRARLENYYAKQVFGGQVPVVEEVVTTLAATIAAGPRIVFDTALSPIDGDEPIIVTTLDGSHLYARFADYTYDIKTGAFVLAPGVSPPVVAGQQLKITYTRKGHQCDGVFWDVVDMPDVYSGNFPPFPAVPSYATDFVAMLRLFAQAHPGKLICYNRGFSVLDELIDTAKLVMFETWSSFPDNIGDLTNTAYHRITDPAAVNENEKFHRQLRRLRTSHVFDVLSLNYALPSQVELRDYCRDQDRRMGYLSWQSTMTLTNPVHNDEIDNAHPSVQSHAFTFYKRKAPPVPPGTPWDGGASVWDGGTSHWDVTP